MMVLMMTKIDREKTGRQHKHTCTPSALYIPGYYYIYKPNKLKTRKIKQAASVFYLYLSLKMATLSPESSQ